MVTRKPARCSSSAHDKPITPQPTTSTESGAMTWNRSAREQVVAFLRPHGETVQGHQASQLADQLLRHVASQCRAARTGRSGETALDRHRVVARLVVLQVFLQPVGAELP